MKTQLLTPDTAGLQAAATALQAGELVAFPTETVYGLGADATNPAAVRSVFRAKGRPADHPLIVHLADPSQLGEWTNATGQALEWARLLARTYWPGPLTLVMPRAQGVLAEVTGGQETVALRVPGHEVALALLRLSGLALVAPSANRFGRISPTRSQHVLAELDGLIPFVIEGGSAEVGVESTILDLSGPEPRVLRPGQISAQQLTATLGLPVTERGQAGSPRVSGSLASHYAPEVPTRLLTRITVEETGSDTGVIATRPAPAGFLGQWRQLPGDPAGYARELYAALRELDSLTAGILVEEPPAGEGWEAIRDRLNRASAGTGTVHHGT